MALERVRLGATDEAAVARVENQPRQRVNESVTALGALASQAAAGRADIEDAFHDVAAARRLFAALDGALPDSSTGTTGVTVYDRQGRAVAWRGRVSEFPPSRIEGSRS